MELPKEIAYHKPVASVILTPLFYSYILSSFTKVSYTKVCFFVYQDKRKYVFILHIGNLLSYTNNKFVYSSCAKCHTEKLFILHILNF